MSISREVLAKYIKPGCVFVETGSRWGDTLVRAVEAGAVRAVGCEVERFLAHVADLRMGELCPKGNASVCASSSVKFLLANPFEMGRDTVLFLDAHAEDNSPVLMELNIVSNWAQKPMAILIDDLRCMHGWGVDLIGLQAKLTAMGYKVDYEDGVQPRDIMVATLG